MIELYKDTCTRIQRGRKTRLTDAEIIEALAQEINYYREKINALTAERMKIIPAPVKTAKWKWISCTYDRTPMEKEYECSECHHKTIVHGDGEPWEHYCPNCGARMDEE